MPGLRSVFYVELVALSVVQPCYFLRFYFWLDLASILTMIPDVMPEMRILSTERVGGAAHFATRAARLFRFVRLIRFATYVNFRGIQFRTPDELPEGQSQACTATTPLHWRRTPLCVCTFWREEEVGATEL